MIDGFTSTTDANLDATVGRVNARLSVLGWNKIIYQSVIFVVNLLCCVDPTTAEGSTVSIDVGDV